MTNPNIIKINAKRNYLAELYKKYTAAYQDLSTVIQDADKVSIQARIDNLEIEINRLENEINKLKNPEEKENPKDSEIQDEDISELFKFVQAFPLEGRTRLIYTCRSDIEKDKFNCPNINPDPNLAESRTAPSHIPVDELETYGLCVAWYGQEIIGNQENFVKDCTYCSKEASQCLGAYLGQISEKIIQYFTRIGLEIKRDNDRLSELLTDNLIIIGENHFADVLFDLIKHQLPWKHTMSVKTSIPYPILGKPDISKDIIYDVKLFFNNCSSSSSSISEQVKNDLTSDSYKWGILTFVPNPFAPDKWIIFLLGCHRRGQYLLLSWLRQAKTNEILSKIIDYRQKIDSKQIQFIQIIVKGELQSKETNILRKWSIEVIEDQKQHLPFFTNHIPINPLPYSNIGDEISDLSLLAKIPSQANFLQSIKNTIWEYPSLRDLFKKEEKNDRIGFHVTLYEFIHTQGFRDRGFIQQILKGRYNFLNELKGEFNNLCSLHLIARQTRITSTSLQVLVDIYMYEEASIRYQRYLEEQANRYFRGKYMNPNAMDLVFECCKYATEQIPQNIREENEFNVEKIPMPLHLTLLRFPQNPDSQLLNQANLWASKYKTKVWGKLENCSIVLTGAEQFPFSQVTVVEIIGSSIQ